MNALHCCRCSLPLGRGLAIVVLNGLAHVECLTAQERTEREKRAGDVLGRVKAARKLKGKKKPKLFEAAP